MVTFAMPPFWIGLLLILGLGLTLKWFPIAGFGEGFLGHLHHLFLPSLTVALFLAPILVQSLRNSMLDVLTADHVEVARAKGLSEWQVLRRHVLRNALIPAITVLAVNISFLVSGAVIVEYVFSIQGLGSLLVRSVGYRDYPDHPGPLAGLRPHRRRREPSRRSELHAGRSPRGRGLR